MPAIIIHVGSFAYEQPPDEHGVRFSLGQQQGTPIALSPRKRDFHGSIGVGRIQPVAPAKKTGGCLIGPRATAPTHPITVQGRL